MTPASELKDEFIVRLEAYKNKKVVSDSYLASFIATHEDDFLYALSLLIAEDNRNL